MPKYTVKISRLVRRWELAEDEVDAPNPDAAVEIVVQRAVNFDLDTEDGDVDEVDEWGCESIVEKEASRADLP